MSANPLPSGWFPVTGITRFAVTGADRVRYLNGQISNDVRKLEAGDARLACVLSARGKLDAVVWVWAEPERLVIEVDEALAEATAARFERYIVADDVSLAPLPPEPTIHVFGPEAAGLGGRQIARMNLPGCDLATPPAGLREWTPAEIDRLRIEQAVPHWGAELGPDTLPAEAGLDLTAVDFHKGCYIGQEVVSRIRSVGHANRALRVFDPVAGEPPQAGAEFFAGEDHSRASAVVTSIHLSGEVGLCYMRRGTSEGAVLTSHDGRARIQLRPPASLHA